MARLKRSAIMHFLSVDDAQNWHLIGAHVEQLSVEMGGTFEIRHDITDSVSVTDNGYTPSFEVTPYYAKRTDALYQWLEDVMMNRKTGSDCVAKYLEVIVSDKSAASHSAWMEDCLIEVGDYGGSTSGFRINYTVHPEGNRIVGKASLSTARLPTFLSTNNAIAGYAVPGYAVVGTDK